VVPTCGKPCRAHLSRRKTLSGRTDEFSPGNAALATERACWARCRLLLLLTDMTIMERNRSSFHILSPDPFVRLLFGGIRTLGAAQRHGPIYPDFNLLSSPHISHSTVQCRSQLQNMTVNRNEKCFTPSLNHFPLRKTSTRSGLLSVPTLTPLDCWPPEGLAGEPYTVLQQVRKLSSLRF
jgi:hypothetical protein